MYSGQSGVEGGDVVVSWFRRLLQALGADGAPWEYCSLHLLREPGDIPLLTVREFMAVIAESRPQQPYVVALSGSRNRFRWWLSAEARAHRAASRHVLEVDLRGGGWQPVPELHAPRPRFRRRRLPAAQPSA
jgi:hypothetical protein